MIKLAKLTALLQVALVVAATLTLCSAGHAQAVSITYPTSGMTFNSSPIAVQLSVTGFASLSDGYVTITDNVGNQTKYTLQGNGTSYYVQCATPPLIPSGATSYNGSVVLQATVTGTTPAVYPNPGVMETVRSSVVTETVQVGYILGASSLNTATVTAPTNGATVHLNPGGAAFTISSDHKADFSRYDAFGTYSPTYSIRLRTTFPNAAGYNIIETGSQQFQLPMQTGDVYTDYTLTHSETYSGSFTSSFNLTFSNEASSFYPPGSQIASGVTTATATYTYP